MISEADKKKYSNIQIDKEAIEEAKKTSWAASTKELVKWILDNTTPEEREELYKTTTQTLIEKIRNKTPTHNP